jgi:DNA helicase HerA-like ATPase
MNIAEGLELAVADLIGQRIAVLGISGSGKTNTVAVLAEELLLQLPMTIVDIEGEYFGLKEKFDLLGAC